MKFPILIPMELLKIPNENEFECGVEQNSRNGAFAVQTRKPEMKHWK